jgi:hypothetical protein
MLAVLPTFRGDSLDSQGAISQKQDPHCNCIAVEAWDIPRTVELPLFLICEYIFTGTDTHVIM